VYQRLPNGAYVVRQEGNTVFLRGQGASPQGDRPFLDALSLRSLKTERLFRSDADAYEQFIGFSAIPGHLLTWHQSVTDAPNAFVRLLGEDVAGRDVVEIGCGSAPCSRWLAGRGARPVAVDLSAGMLRVGAEAMVAAGEPRVPLVQADARRLPFSDESFDLAFSAFGAIPFVADPEMVMAEAARVLRPGGRFVFSVNHPMRWIFRDDPGPAGLEAVFPYFDRSPYVEHDDEGRLVYVEHHRTVGDRIRDLVGAGFVLDELVEPEWPEWLEEEWGQWSPLRGAVFPGTAIFRAHLP